MHDLVIQNGTIATASDVFAADIAIRDGVIVQIGKALGDAAETIDASGHYVLPGGIDAHVHLSQPSAPGIVMADDFESGTRSALWGGNTTVMPFCLQERGRPLRDVVDAYHALAEGRCYTDVSFHLIVNEPSASVLGQELPALVASGYRSFKVFMTYDDLRLGDGEILKVMETARRTGAVVMVHCENEDAIRHLIERHAEAGQLEPASHASTRPIVVEREATHRALSLAEVADVPIVIVHVSNGEAIEEIERGRRRGGTVVAETCPQYLVLTADDLKGMDWEGAKFVCSPPPRDKASQEACWAAIQRGTFDLFSSDHCPFRYDDERGKLNPKGRKDFRHIPNGIPGIETRLPILFSEGVSKGRIDITRFVAMTSTNPAKIYGLAPRKGSLSIGSDADITIWDPEARRTIRHAELHDNADYTPYEGLEVIGWPMTVVLRGHVALRDGELLARPGIGKYRHREA